MSERISVEISNGVADIRLTRADKMNALDDAMFTALVETGERMKTEKGVRAIVLSGEGRAFCAGLDMTAETTTNPNPAKEDPLWHPARMALRTGRNMQPGSGARCLCPSLPQCMAWPLVEGSRSASALICAM